MAIYAVGDIQGYYDPLAQLLEIMRFDPSADQLWVAGDMVNRGPDSLKVLRFIRSLGETAKPVLGNHELHLLAVATGVRLPKRGDTFQEVLEAPELDELVLWLRHLPFVHMDKSIKTLMVHAGVYCKWSRKKLLRLSKEVEAVLQGDDYIEFLKNLSVKGPKKWKKTLQGWDRYRFIANACTKLRFCSSKGKIDFRYKGPPGSQPHKLVPWFRHPRRSCNKWRIVFGHWSTLGYCREANVISLDSGCLWGKKLTAVQLDCEEERIWQIGCS